MNFPNTLFGTKSVSKLKCSSVHLINWENIRWRTCCGFCNIPFTTSDCSLCKGNILLTLRPIITSMLCIRNMLSHTHIYRIISFQNQKISYIPSISLNTFPPKWVLFWCSSFSFWLQSYFARTSFSCELFINSIRALYMNYVFNILFSHHPYWFDLICGSLDFESMRESDVLPKRFALFYWNKKKLLYVQVLK